MRNLVRSGWLALISIFSFLLIISCAGNSSNTFTIEGSVTPAEAGDVSPETGEYDEGAQVEIMAEANENWMFSSWEGDLSGTDNPAVITVENDMIFTAIFERLQHPLEINIDGGGTVEETIVESKMADYEVGTVVELNAVADDGWVFVEWQGDLNGSENPQTLAMDDTKSVTAVFERKDYPLSVQKQGEGNVTEEVVQEPAKDYAYETVVELTANAAENWEFARWEGDLDGSENPKEITIDGEKEVTAVFERQGFELTVNVTGEGTVDEELVDGASKTSYPFDSVVELTANPADGWTFVRWEGDLNGSESPEQITMDEDRNITAVFERRDYALNITLEGEGSVNEEVVSEPAKDYTYETVVELTASAAEGWNFVRWEGDLEGSENPQEITVDEEKSVTAIFEQETFDLTVDITGQGSVNEEATGTAGKTAYGFNTIVTLTAESDEGWGFDHWEGDLDGSDNPKEITIDGNKNVTAVFTEAQYELDQSTDGDGTVSVEPAKDFYNHGDEIEITASPDELWQFKNWDGDLSGSENPKTVTVTSDLSIVAVFGTRANVETASLNDMRVNSITGGGEVTDNGGFEVIERGVCWSSNEFPHTGDDCSSDGNGLGSFTSDISGLTQGFTYYVRAYATNEAGTNYGESVEFKAGYVSHGYVSGVTPGKDDHFRNRSYKLVESNWKGGENRVWIELNLGATGPVKTVTDNNAARAGWYFQFNRRQGHHHTGDVRVPNTSWDGAYAENSDWETDNDPCRAAFGGKWRVPTAAEWQSFYIASEVDGGMESSNYHAAFGSLLRLHAAGAIDTDGNIFQRGSIGMYWTSDQVDSETGSYFGTTSGGSGIADISKAGGLSVRCVKN